MIKLYLLFTIFALTLITNFYGCSSQPEFPSINYTSTKDYNYGQVVWRDLVTPDPKKAAQFYKDVFGWTSSQVGSEDNPYWIFKSNGKPVGGMYLMSDAKKNAGGEWVPYFSVSSLNDLINKSKAAGGNLIIKPIEQAGRGNVALLTDNESAYFAIIKSVNGDPTPAEPLEFQFLWNELWSNDMQKSADYYKSIFNSQIEEKTDDARDYLVIKNNNKSSSGIIKNPVENVRTHWIQYVRVTNPNDIEKKITDAGGKILITVDSTIRNGTVSVFADPTGAPIAIQKWPIE